MEFSQHRLQQSVILAPLHHVHSTLWHTHMFIIIVVVIIIMSCSEKLHVY